jgi:uncharacterized membrane-anchored protein
VAYRRELLRAYLDSVNTTIKYQKGKVAIKDIAELEIPEQYRYIPADKAEMIVHDLWKNPKSNNILGMIVKSDYSLTSDDTWAFIIRYDEDGYVNDEDADKINYDDLLKEIQKSEDEENVERKKEGYPPIHMLGWATKPYYDKEHKVLHWAKKLQFGDTDPDIALNYDVRILGRKGILSLNAVGDMEQLGDIDKCIPEVIKIAKFTNGNQYKDFNPSMDKVAAYTIGGLIAGKLIAKTGLLVLLLKNIKLILIGLFGGFAAFRKKLAGIFSRKKKQENDVAEPVAIMPAEEGASETDNSAAAIEAEPVAEANTEPVKESQL